jgi:hypothetical protein
VRTAFIVRAMTDGPTDSHISSWTFARFIYRPDNGGSTRL